MAIRSHLGRTFDFRLLSNRLILGLTAVIAAAGVWQWATTDNKNAIWAGAHAFIAWSVMRELDPDHDWTALAMAAFTGVWVLGGLPIVSAFVSGALILAPRYVVSSTGRRPLPVDYAVTGVYAVAISYIPLGWVAGFGIAIAMYVDDRMADEHRPIAAISALLTAVGASVVATASEAFPDTAPTIRPIVLLTVGLLALLAIVRRPPPPVSLVDSRRKTPISQDRLHAARSLFGLLLFAMAFLAGVEASVVGPLAIGIGLALIADELGRLRRRRS